MLGLRISAGFGFLLSAVAAAGMGAAPCRSEDTTPPATPPDTAAVVAPVDSLDAIKQLIQEGNLVDAERRARDVLAAFEREHGPESLQVAAALDLLVESLRHGGKGADPEARLAAERAVRIKESRLGSEHLDVATSVTNLAHLSFETGDFAGARSLYKRALGIREKLLGPDHLEVARSLNGVGNVELSTGNYTAARQCYERALAIRSRTLGDEHLDVATSLGNLAALLQEIGDYAAARAHNERALAIREKLLGPEHVDLGMSLGNLSGLLTETGDYTLARSLGDRALRIYEKGLGAGHPWVAVPLSNLAMLTYHTGDYAAARSYLDRALAILEANPGREHPNFANVLSFKAGLLQQTGDYETARTLYEEALAILERTVGPTHHNVAATLSNLATLHEASHEYQKARDANERALAVRESVLGADHPHVAESLTNLGNLCESMRDLAQAKVYYQRSLTICEQAFEPGHPVLARCHSDLAHLLLVLGERRASLHHALAAEAIAHSSLRLTSQGLSESQALRYLQARTSGLPLALSISSRSATPEDVRAVWGAAVRSRALLLDEMTARRRSAVSSGDALVDSLWSAVAGARSRLANLTVRGLGQSEPAMYRELLEDAGRAKEAGERALAERSASFRIEQARAEVGLSEILQTLPSETALVAYSRYDEPSSTVPDSIDGTRYLAFVGRRGGGDADSGRVVVIPLGDAAEIDGVTSRWRVAVSHSDRDDPDAETACRAVGDSLRRLVWDPVDSELARISQVFVVPDGMLHLLSFAALPTDSGQYLAESGPLIHYLSAERDLVSTPTPDDAQGRRGLGLLVLGDPDYDRVPSKGRASRGRAANPLDPEVILFRGAYSNCGEFSELEFSRLPETARESREVEEGWKAVRPQQPILALREQRANEAELKRSIRGHQVVHLATHGFFLGEGCPASDGSSHRGVRLRVKESPEVPPSVVGENPLLLSGLALAGANRREEAGPDQEDGILTAEEVGALDLDGTEWVVLSACGTGLGELRSGEGVFGLRRAFEIAGAETLIMSLWSVSDEVTRRWMGELYKARLEGGKTTAQSVQAASLALLARQRREGLSTHPAHWAPFIASGNWK